MGPGLVVGMRQVVAAALVLLVAGAFPVAAEDGFYEQAGVEYYMAVGEHTTGAVDLGTNASVVQPFDGCAIAKVRPDKGLGRVQLLGSLHGVPLQLEMSRFAPAGDGTGDGIAVDVPVDGSRTHGVPQHPPTQADIAGWGEALLEVAGATYQDPATGRDAFAASFFVTQEGIRDEASRALRPGAEDREAGDAELHLRILSQGNVTGGPHSDQAVVPQGAAGLPGMYEPPVDDYRAVHAFENVRFGANATLDIQGSGVPGLATDMVFRLRDPSGVLLHQVEWTSAATDLGGGVDATHSFVLDRFGTYLVEVEGSSGSPFQYMVSLDQQAAPPLDLSFWWEGVSLGSYALEAEDTCRDAVAVDSQPVTGSVPARPEPPGWPVVTVVLTVLGIAAALLVTVKMAVMRRASRHPLESKVRD